MRVVSALIPIVDCLRFFESLKCLSYGVRCQKETESDHLLLVTRTRTDARGRRHSVAVPVLPPPDGEKFAGGYQVLCPVLEIICKPKLNLCYQIQRNPITGGARLLPPPAPGQ